MKTIYSLQEFLKLAEGIALKKGINYAAVSVETSSHTPVSAVFKCYAHGYDWYTGATMEECLGKMRDAMFPPELPNQDVEIEIQEQIKAE